MSLKKALLIPEDTFFPLHSYFVGSVELKTHRCLPESLPLGLIPNRIYQPLFSPYMELLRHVSESLHPGSIPRPRSPRSNLAGNAPLFPCYEGNFAHIKTLIRYFIALFVWLHSFTVDRCRDFSYIFCTKMQHSSIF